ncbi:MAG: DUF721 domain-containing protein [Candidatus Ancillula sp.]|jgi:hypothetical protein|nr:DUF721 domain-containing protein [Candidatus Ancillula sp.]
MTPDLELAEMIFKKVTASSRLGLSRNFVKHRSSGVKHDPIGLKLAFNGLKIAEHWDVKIKQAKLKNNWSIILPAGLHEHFEVVGFNERIMYVKPEDASWGASFLANKPSVLKSVNQFLGEEFLIDVLIKKTDAVVKKSFPRRDSRTRARRPRPPRR